MLEVNRPLRASIAAIPEGRTMRYRVAIQNRSDRAVQSVVAELSVPPGGNVTFYSRPDGGSVLESNKVTWSVPLLTGSAVEILECTAEFACADPDTVGPAGLQIWWSGDARDEDRLATMSARPGQYHGGHNVAADLYRRVEALPRFNPAGTDLGVLRGTWRQIGIQHAERTGPIIQAWLDTKFQALINHLGSAQHVVEDVRRYEVEIRKFSPQAVEFMRGIAEGGKRYLEKSRFAHALSDYEKIVFLNCETCMERGHPGPEAHSPIKEHGCSGIVVLGQASKDGKTVFAHNCDSSSFALYGYGMTYVAIPEERGAVPFWSTASPGKINGLMAVNAMGVAQTIFAGPTRTWVPEEGIYERAFGVPWNIIQFMQAAYAKSAQESVDFVTIGTPEYRSLTGRSTLLRTRQNSWMIADPNEAFVVENTAHRYGIRRPGDHGEDGFIVVANHFLCDSSYDDQNRLTTFPMTKFGNEQTETQSAPRWHTLWWLASKQRGQVTADLVREWLGSHFVISPEGHRVDYQWDDEHGWVGARFIGRTLCNHGRGYPETYEGSTTDSKLAVLDDRTVFWSYGRPCEYTGMPRVFKIPPARP